MAEVHRPDWQAGEERRKSGGIAKVIPFDRRARRNMLRTLRATADEIAQEMAPNVRVFGAVGAREGSRYAEIFIGDGDCEFDPCRVTVGVDVGMSRDDLRPVIARAIEMYRDRLTTERATS